MLAAELEKPETSRAQRIITHPAMVGFGLANLYLLDLTDPIIANDHDLIYHLTGSASSVIVPVIVYLLALSVLFAGLLRLAERPGALRVMLWSGFLLALPSIVVHMIGTFSGDEIPDWLTRLVGLLCLSAFLAVCFFWRRFLPRFEKMQPMAASVLGFFAFVGVLVFPQLVWNGWEARDLNAPRALHHAQGNLASPRPRVIWLLFDELSYQQIYETRFPGLALPAFDRLSAQSTVFTHVVPAGKFTHYIVPSLLTGMAADEIDVSASGLLVSLQDPETDKWKRFDQHGTVFQDALDAGYSTGVAGWYNPYCRIVPAVLDRCFWTYRESTPGDMSPNRSLARDLVRPLHYLVLDVAHAFGYGPGSPSDESLDLRQHTADYKNLVAAGDADLKDPRLGFLFLHMPIPHPYGFYDRRTKAFATKHTSYIDNLALADVYLAHVRQVLEAENEWDSTTLVVMGDHSWRTKFVWKDSDSWTDEDEAASHGGKFDDRPAYLVKLPNQQTGARVDRSFSAVSTRALLDGLLERRFHDAEDLRRWVGEQKRDNGAR